MKISDSLVQKLNSTALVYVTVEVERALGLEQLLPNYHIICYEDSPIIDELLSKGISVFSVARNGLENQVRKTTAAMLKAPEVKEHIQKVSEGKHFLLQTFHPTPMFSYQAKQYDCTLLNNEVELTEDITDKLTLAEVMNQQKIQIPKFTVEKLNNVSWEETCQKLESTKLVIQNRKSHTGEGTYILDSEADLLALKSEAGENEFKVSQYIAGDSWTINGCIYRETTLVGGLSYQITGIPELTNHPGSTVGNDWCAAHLLSEVVTEKIKKMTVEVGNLLISRKYKGLFGIDVVVENEEVYLIEVNTRQTANIPMQSFLEQAEGVTPLAVFHLYEFMNIDETSYEFKLLSGAQLFNRAKQDLNVNSQVKIGEYRLQSDNAAHDFDHNTSSEGVIFLDEDQDKPLVWQGATYNVTQISPTGMQLLAGTLGSYKENQELARIQTRVELVDKERIVKPWAIEALLAVEKLQK